MVLDTLDIIFLLIFFLIVIIIGKSISSDYIKQSIPEHFNKHPLPDIIHANTSSDWKYKYFYVETFFYLLIAMGLYKLWYANQLMTVFEIGLIWEIFHVFKLLCTMVTILPDPSGMCHTKGTIGGCNELMPSGHSSMLLIMLFIIWDYLDTYWKISFLLLFAIYVIMNIVVRNHYTIDIVMGSMVSYAMYKFFHPYFT
jgi:membrane-associated phospholipid phosphatase